MLQSFQHLQKFSKLSKYEKFSEILQNVSSSAQISCHIWHIQIRTGYIWLHFQRDICLYV